MKKLSILIILFALILIIDSHAQECQPGYKWCRMCGINCIQENCNDIPHAHYSYTSQCICASDDNIDDPAEDKYSKRCMLPNNDLSCPGCLHSCILPTEKCPWEKEDTKADVKQDADTPDKNTEHDPEDDEKQSFWDWFFVRDAESVDEEKDTELLEKLESMYAVKLPDEIDEEDWKNVSDSLRKNREKIDYDQFLIFLMKLEQENPDKDWKEICAYLHAYEYGVDLNSSTPILPIKLFAHGDETEGYKDVKKVSIYNPWIIDGPNGHEINVAHAYAVLRSDLNREDKNGVQRWFMRKLNGHWGDTFQVVFDSIDKAPKDQRRGNDAGEWLSNYYSKEENKDTKLSAAFADYLEYFRQNNPPDKIDYSTIGDAPLYAKRDRMY